MRLLHYASCAIATQGARFRHGLHCMKDTCELACTGFSARIDCSLYVNNRLLQVSDHLLDVIARRLGPLNDHGRYLRRIVDNFLQVCARQDIQIHLRAMSVCCELLVLHHG